MTDRDLTPDLDHGSTTGLGADEISDAVVDEELSDCRRPREKLVHLLQRLRDRDAELTTEGLDLVASRLGLSPVQVHGVVTFNRRPAPIDRRPSNLDRGRAGLGESPPTSAGDVLPAPPGRLGELLERKPEEIVGDVALWASRSEWEDLVRFGERMGRVASEPGPGKVVISTAAEAKAPLGGRPRRLTFDAELLVEGMIIAARSVGAGRGLVCLPGSAGSRAVEVEAAVSRMAAQRLGLGSSGEDTGLEIEVLRGFEDPLVRNASALIAALEGRRGTPGALAPAPTSRGLWGFPTFIAGAQAFVEMARFLVRGERRVGTPVVIDGAVRRPGRTRVRPHISLLELVMDQGCGPTAGRSIKAVLVGGASGRVIPAGEMEVSQLGSSAGVGRGPESATGITVVADGDCIVALAGKCLSASVEGSCGTCSPCRIGLPVLHETLDRLVTHGGSKADLALLQNLGELVARTSMCGFGRTAPTPLLSSLRHFEHEYRAHVDAGGCGAVCTVGEH